jgi:hypothetical protein
VWNPATSRVPEAWPATTAIYETRSKKLHLENQSQQDFTSSKNAVKRAPVHQANCRQRSYASHRNFFKYQMPSRQNGGWERGIGRFSLLRSLHPNSPPQYFQGDFDYTQLHLHL